MGEEQPASGEGFSIGAVVRRLRQERGLSLQALATASGVSTGMLSQIERNLTNPSVRVLTGIRRALNAPLSALFEEAPRPPSDPGFVRRAGNRPMLDLGHLRKELLSSGGAHNMQFMILHIDPQGSSGATPLSYPAEKGGMILAGQITMKVGEEETVLKEGDSFMFDSSIAHSFRNEGTEPARVLWIIGAVPLERHL